MAAKTRKRNQDWIEFKEWQKEKKRIRQQYKSAEKFYRFAFEQFKHQVRNGEIDNVQDAADFEVKMRIGSARMVFDELDRVITHWLRQIPPLKFKEEWEVTVWPSFMGTMARFHVNGFISVYLDVYDRLGFYGKPYWELYDGLDTMRFKMEDTEGLLSTIDRLVELQKLPEDIRKLMQQSEEN